MDAAKFEMMKFEITDIYLNRNKIFHFLHGRVGFRLFHFQNSPAF